ncbi:MAG: pitrilysin family protein [Acidobacteriota bacterium]
MTRLAWPVLGAAVLLGALVPFGPPISAAAAPDRSHPPKPGAPVALRLPETSRLQLSNGIPVFLVERHKVPLAEVLVILRGGASADPANRPGLASLTADLLDRGAGSRSALEISDLADTLGAALEAEAGWDTTTVGINVPVARLSDAMALIADLVRNPTFPPEELERVRQERLTGMLQWRDDPAEIAAAAFARAVYGRHAYGRRPEGSPASIRSVTRDEVRRFHAARYTPAGAAIVVVGDVRAAEALPLLNRAFGSWAASGPASAVSPPAAAPQLSGRRVILVDKPEAPQSQIWIGRVGPPRSTPDYFPLLVANTILGGSFTSRLNHNLRETKGYTYGAFSQFDYRISTGPFLASAAVQTDKTGPALTEFFRELEAIREETPAPELERARNYAALRYPAGFETDGQVAGRVRDQFVYGLPDDYFNTYVGRIQAVTAADVRRVARQWIDPRSCAIVVVGDRRRIEAQVAALHLGPVTFLSVEDVLGGPGKSSRP